YKWSSAADLMGTVFATGNLVTMLSQFALVFVFSIIASVMTNKPVKASLRVFPILYIVSVAALILEGNAAIKAVNLEAVIFSLSIGLVIGNFFRLPEWFRSVLNAEMFVKIGLVLLGTRIIFGDILEAGSLGMAQAL